MGTCQEPGPTSAATLSRRGDHQSDSSGSAHLSQLRPALLNAQYGNEQASTNMEP